MNADDKKGLWLVGIVLVILIILLVGIKGCDKTKLQEDTKTPEVTQKPTPKPQEDLDTSLEKEEEENTITNMNYDNSGSNSFAVSIPQKVESISLDSYLSVLESYYQVEVNENGFLLPVVEVPDFVSVQVEYQFRGLYESEFYHVSSFSSDDLGTYKVVYTVSSKEQSVKKEVFIEVVDTELPSIEGMIETYNPETNITTYEPVKNGSIINQIVTVSFSDNHEISYAEYYKAKYEFLDGGHTIEEEGMQEIIEIDFNQDLILYEDGEYHVRAYDVSGNVSEYVVTIDRTNPIIEVTYSRIDKNQTLVTITSLEELQELDGFILSSDKKSLTKVFYNQTFEEVTVSDLAGNKASVTIKTENVEVSFTVLQNNMVTSSTNLNTNDGEIVLKFESTPGILLQYSIDGSEFTLYQGEAISKEGYYKFQAVLDEKVMDTLEFYVSSMTVED